MKFFAAFLLACAITTAPAFAREPKATLFGDIAKTTVKTMFAQKGDKVSQKLKDMDHGDEGMAEVWEVSLTNGANKGSAIYEVYVKQNSSDTSEGSEVATVKVKFVSGN